MKFLTLLTAGMMTAAIPAAAQTDIQWWHAMGGRLGEVVEEIAVKYNAAKTPTTWSPPTKAATRTP